MKTNWTRGMLWTALTTVAGILLGVSPAAFAQGNVVLYELTESMRITGPGKAVKRAATSALAGWAAVGTPLCPKSLALAYGLDKCTVNVKASNRINLNTGRGPADGTFEVVVQDQNTEDAAEIVVLSGSIDATMDLSGPISRHEPFGTITGTWSADGLRGGPLANLRNLRGTFTGVFRLPLVVMNPLDCVDPNGNAPPGCWVSAPSYIMGDGSRHELKPAEFSLGVATVRLEINLR